MYDEDDAEHWIGKTFAGTWRIERVLGTGGMGSVLLGRAADGSEVALKVLHPELNAYAEVRKRFLREGHIANALGGAESLPGVPRMIGSGETPEGLAYLAMEVLRGETLFDRMARAGTMPPDEVLALADQVLDGLVAAHAHGVVHRDLKPENIHLGADGRVRMLDFGIARVLDGIKGMPDKTATKTGMIMGTATYMAPEQATGLVNEIDGRTDLFGLGATMFRLLSGRPVHGDISDALEVIAAATEAAPPLLSVAPPLPPALCAVVDRSLAFVKHHRYPDARAMQADVRALRAGHPPPYAGAILEGRLQAGQAMPAQPAAALPHHAPAAASPRYAVTPAAGPHGVAAASPHPTALGLGAGARPLPTLIEPAPVASTAPDHARPGWTQPDLVSATSPGEQGLPLAKVALIVGVISTIAGIVVGIVLVGC